MRCGRPIAGTVGGFESTVATVAFVDLAGFSALDPAWIDPVCKMHAPYSAYLRDAPTGPWFCSDRCAEAYRRSPETYPRIGQTRGRA